MQLKNSEWLSKNLNSLARNKNSEQIYLKYFYLQIFDQNITLCIKQDEPSNNRHWSKSGSENGFWGVFQWNPNILYGKFLINL